MAHIIALSGGLPRGFGVNKENLGSFGKEWKTQWYLVVFHYYKTCKDIEISCSRFDLLGY